MNITIIGSNGFIGSNLSLSLEDESSFEKLFKITTKSPRKELKTAINSSEIVINLAGVNRSKSDDDFIDVNVNFAREIATMVSKSPKTQKLLYASSAHAGRDDIYGKTKFQGEEAVKEILKKTNKEYLIERFPGIFGKNCKPYYNSVVATFCYNIANGKENIIDDPSAEINICYIDDVIAYIRKRITRQDKEIKLEPVYSIRVGDLDSKIKLIANSENFIPDMGCSLTKKLHATYLFYKKPNDFVTDLIVHEDIRGSFSEIVKTEKGGQFSFVTANPGQKRGVHYHHTKTEKFLVLSGKAIFKQKNLFTGEVYEFFLDSDTPKTIDSIPGHVHSIENVGDEKLIAVIWCNEIFDKDNPDTFFREMT